MNANTLRRARVQLPACEGQRTACRSWRSSSTMWSQGSNSGDQAWWEWTCQILWQLLIFEEVSRCSSLSVFKSLAVIISTKEMLQLNNKNTSHSFKETRQSQRKTLNGQQPHEKILNNSGCQGNLNQNHVLIYTWDDIHTKQNQPHNKCRQRHREVGILRQCWYESEMVQNRLEQLDTSSRTVSTGPSESTATETQDNWLAHAHSSLQCLQQLISDQDGSANTGACSL